LKYGQTKSLVRKLIYAINLTLDGCCDHTKMIADEEVHEYHTQLVRDADTLLYGRKTYQLMVPFWPDVAKSNSAPNKAMNDFAQAFDTMNQIVVFSKSLDKAEGKTSVVRANLRDEILSLKQKQGKNILTGGAAVPSQLIQLGLVDEYHIVFHPIIAGEGRRLLEGINFMEKLQLKFIGSKIFGSGCVALHYLKQ
jgi:dihydrofolate reductase